MNGWVGKLQREAGSNLGQRAGFRLSPGAFAATNAVSHFLFRLFFGKRSRIACEGINPKGNCNANLQTGHSVG